MPRYWAQMQRPDDDVLTEEMRAVVRDELEPARARSAELEREAATARGDLKEARAKDEGRLRNAVTSGKSVKDVHATENAVKAKHETTLAMARAGREAVTEAENRIWGLVNRDIGAIYENGIQALEAVAAEHAESLSETVRLARERERLLEQVTIAGAGRSEQLWDQERQRRLDLGEHSVPDKVTFSVPRPLVDQPVGRTRYRAADLYDELLAHDVGIKWPAKRRTESASSFEAKADTAGGHSTQVHV